MSFDRKIEQACPHIVREELLTVSEDRTTVTPLRPISSVNSISLRLNGEHLVPQEGLYAPPLATSTKEGLVSLLGETLTLDVSNYSTQTYVSPTAKDITPQRVADYLNLSLSGVQFSVSARGRLEVRGSAKGPSSTLRLGGALASKLGFHVGREYRGATITPAWSVVNDPNTLLDRPLKLIVFDQPLRTTANHVEIDYATVREECRRCGGIGRESDWRYAQGKVVEARDEVLLIQEFSKALFTIKGSNPFAPWYGSDLERRIGGKQLSGGLVKNQITQDVHETWRSYQSIKRQYEQQGARLTDAEYPYQLNQVSVTDHPTDPTILYLHVTISSRSLRPTPITRALRLPQPLVG